jgi:hypothetical protein
MLEDWSSLVIGLTDRKFLLPHKWGHLLVKDRLDKSGRIGSRDVLKWVETLRSQVQVRTEKNYPWQVQMS